MAKKNGRKKIRKIKPGKNLPEKISGKLWAENLPANLFEKKNPEKKSGNQAGLTPEEYLCLFRRASMIAGEHDQKSCWGIHGHACAGEARGAGTVQPATRQQGHQGHREQGTCTHQAAGEAGGHAQHRQQSTHSSGQARPRKGKAAQPSGSKDAQRHRRPESQRKQT